MPRDTLDHGIVQVSAEGDEAAAFWAAGEQADRRSAELEQHLAQQTVRRKPIAIDACLHE